MYCLSFLSVAAVLSLAAAEFVVINHPTFSRNAKEACEDDGLTLAKLKSGRHGNIYKATKALYKAKVGEAWVASVDGHKHNHRLFLRKPENFRDSDDDGKVVKAKCDDDKVCNVAKAVLCYKPGKGKHSRKGRSSRRNRRRNNNNNRSCRKDDENCQEEEDDDEEEEEEYYKPQRSSYSYGENYKQPAKYY